MTSNDNTVNMKSRASRYHHGDLRAALIEEGLAELSSRAPDEVSLREIARRAGVSATAVYRHFPDKAALLGAMCDVGAARMTDALREAMEKAPDGRAAFVAMGRVYVRFALANPSLFRLMMTHPSPATDDAASGQEVWEDRLRLVSQALQGVMSDEATPEQRRVRKLQAWAIVHGLAMLMLDGQIPVEDAVIDKVIGPGVF